MITRKAMTVLLVMGMLVQMTVSAGAAAAASKPTLLTSETAAAVIGDTVWLALMWQADVDLPGFEVTVLKDDGAEIGYPENTGDHAAPYQSADLVAGEIDFTSIKMHVPENVKNEDKLKIQVEASWEGKKKRESAKYNVVVPLVTYDGADFQRSTDQVDVSAGEVTWVDIAYRGLAPALTDFAVAVSGSASLPVTYPAYGATTSLHYDAILEDGETDVVRFRVDATAATPGQYDFEVVTSYVRGTEARVVSDLIVVVVASGG